jgi:hypothetical protein
MLKELLSTDTQKQIIGVSLTPGIGLEVVAYDRNKNAVLNYGRERVEYNFSTREIQDYIGFKTALSDLLREMNIPPKAMAYLVLPNVHFDFVEIPSSIAETEIKTAILSKAEDFYLFKKEEPVSGWCDVANISSGSQRKLVYTSFQKNSVDTLKDIFADVGLQLVGIESAYSATIRGLFSIGYLDEVLSRKESWTAMLINTNSFTLMYFDGENLLDCSEVPIAIKSFSQEEAYAAIASNVSQLLDSFSSSKLYIISQTDDISAEILKKQMTFDKEIVTIDSNKYAKKPIVEVLQSPDFNQANALTLAGIGASSVKTEFSLVLNVMADDPNANLGVYFTTNIFGVVVDVTSGFVLKMVIVISAVLAVIFIIICLSLYLVKASVDQSIADLSSQIQDVDNKIAAQTTTEVKQEVDMNQIIDDIAQTNVKAIKFYDSIASDMPKNIWLTKYYNQLGDRIVVQGVAESIVDIYEYYKNLKIVSPESDIKLAELKVVTNVIDNEATKNLTVDTEKDRLYTFEISNTSVNYSDPVSSEDNDVLIKTNVDEVSEQAKPI